MLLRHPTDCQSALWLRRIRGVLVFGVIGVTLAACYSATTQYLKAVAVWNGEGEDLGVGCDQLDEGVDASESGVPTDCGGRV
jgi:hypothetical protein